MHNRRKKDLKRKDGKRSPYDTVLIVCEGQKTEVSYFTSLVKVYRLNTANVKILSCKKNHSAPINVVEYAIKLAKLAKKGGYFDKVICVFDYDCHDTFDKAIKK